MTQFIEAKDGCKIAYSLSGSGLGLVLLHGGFIQNRKLWADLSYIRSLQQTYTVVAIDIRGHGESDKPKEEQAYSIERLVEDIYSVTEAAKLTNFLIWGFSLGASISLHAATKRKLCGVVAAGSFFSQALIDYSKHNIPSLAAAVEARDENRLDSLTLSPEERFFVEKADLDVALAISRAMANWPKIEPEMVTSPLLIYAGTNDEPTYSILQEQSDAIQSAGIELSFIEELDHFQAVSEKQLVLPIVERFLASCHS
ncbi:MAG: alpha/beta hydrolase [Cyanobacteria bacterium J06555_13]